MNIFQLLGMFFIISATKAIFDGLTYKSWTKKKLVYGILKHQFGIVLIGITAILFAAYGRNYDIANIKGTIILFLSFACFNFVWFNPMYRIFSGEKKLLGDNDIIDLMMMGVLSLIYTAYKRIFKSDPGFSFVPVLWFIKLGVFSLGLWMLDKFIAI